MARVKTNKLTAMLSDHELQMLRELAGAEDAGVSEMVRLLVRGAYAKKFKAKIPGAIMAPTLRAIVDDISGPVHHTAGNVATRTGLPLPLVSEILKTLERKGAVQCIDHKRPLPGQQVRHESENWTWELTGPRDRIFSVLEKAGLDVDADLTPKS